MLRNNKSKNDKEVTIKVDTSQESNLTPQEQKKMNRSRKNQDFDVLIQVSSDKKEKEKDRIEIDVEELVNEVDNEQEVIDSLFADVSEERSKKSRSQLMKRGGMGVQFDSPEVLEMDITPEEFVDSLTKGKGGREYRGNNVSQNPPKPKKQPPDPDLNDNF